jgi:hypothetical protein
VASKGVTATAGSPTETAKLQRPQHASEASLCKHHEKITKQTTEKKDKIERGTTEFSKEFQKNFKKFVGKTSKEAPQKPRRSRGERPQTNY